MQGKGANRIGQQHLQFLFRKSQEFTLVGHLLKQTGVIYSLAFELPKRLLGDCPRVIQELFGIDIPVSLDFACEAGKRVCFNTDRLQAGKLSFNERRTAAAERIQKHVVILQGETFYVITDKMRRV